MQFFGNKSEDEGRIKSYHTRLITAADNVLFQYELGLIDELLIPSTRAMVVNQYPHWVAAGMSILPRVQACYEEFKGYY